MKSCVAFCCALLSPRVALAFIFSVAFLPPLLCSFPMCMYLFTPRSLLAGLFGHRTCSFKLYVCAASEAHTRSLLQQLMQRNTLARLAVQLSTHAIAARTIIRRISCIARMIPDEKSPLNVIVNKKKTYRGHKEKKNDENEKEKKRSSPCCAVLHDSSGGNDVMFSLYAGSLVLPFAKPEPMEAS